MSVREFWVTDDMTDEQRAEVHRRFGDSVKVQYITSSGERIDPPRIPFREGDLEIVCPHPKLGVEKMRWNDELVVRTVTNENGGVVPGSKEQFRSILTVVSREKGWVIDWEGFDDPPAPPKRKRGRPKGSKNKPKVAKA